MVRYIVLSVSKKLLHPGKTKIEKRQLTDNNRSHNLWLLLWLGFVPINENDLLFYGASGFAESIVNDSFPFPLKTHQPYSPDFFQGFSIELNGSDLKQMAGKFNHELIEHVTALAKRNASIDATDIKLLKSRVNRITWKHMYVPIYIGGYRYGQTYYPVVVNAATGEVAGRAPYSTLKTVGLVFLSFNIITVLCRKFFQETTKVGL